MAEHMRPEGLSQGYYCTKCGAGGLNMYGMGGSHGMGTCPNPPNPDLVKELQKLNRQEAQRWQTEDDRRREQMRAVQRPRLYDQTQPEPSGKPTDGGRWIKRDVDIHRCPKPNYSTGVNVGDEWKCDKCSKVWVVSKIDGDQRDGSTWIIWEQKTVLPSCVTTEDDYYGPYGYGTQDR